jgi:hypothetical protein
MYFLIYLSDQLKEITFKIYLTPMLNIFCSFMKILESLHLLLLLGTHTNAKNSLHHE